MSKLNWERPGAKKRDRPQDSEKVADWASDESAQLRRRAAAETTVESDTEAAARPQKNRSAGVCPVCRKVVEAGGGIIEAKTPYHVGCLEQLRASSPRDAKSGRRKHGSTAARNATADITANLAPKSNRKADARVWTPETDLKRKRPRRK